MRVPDGGAADLRAAAAGFGREIAAAGGIDVQVLGIGANGHVGFVVAVRTRPRHDPRVRAHRPDGA